jgi:hypothetical protein
MTTDGGGWTLINVLGMSGRPSSWTGNSYPRPGASFYGSLATVTSDVSSIMVGGQSATNYSVDAAELYGVSTHEILAYVGGGTTDYITGTLPASCNFFDGSTFCAENTYTGLTLYTSNGGILTTNAQACTSITSQTHNEFGLHLLDGTESGSSHCHTGTGNLGHQDNGRVFTNFAGSSSTSTHWTRGVHSHWNESGDHDEPGFLMLR